MKKKCKVFSSCSEAAVPPPVVSSSSSPSHADLLEIMLVKGSPTYFGTCLRKPRFPFVKNDPCHDIASP